MKKILTVKWYDVLIGGIGEAIDSEGQVHWLNSYYISQHFKRDAAIYFKLKEGVQIEAVLDASGLVEAIDLVDAELL